MPFISHSIRIEEDLFRILKLRSITHHRSFNQEVIFLLRSALETSEYYDREALRALQEKQTRGLSEQSASVAG
jgi:plasmid stability protein